MSATSLVAIAGLFLTTAVASAQPDAGMAQVRITGPTGMKVWVQQPRTGRFAPHADLTTPGRLNLRQGETYRLKLADLPGRPGLVLYPTLTIAPGNPQVAAFLRHSAIRLELTPGDLDDAAEGKLVTKTILHGPGAALAAIRLGNIDLEADPIRP